MLVMNNPVEVKNYRCKKVFHMYTNGNDNWVVDGVYGRMYLDGFHLNKQKAIQQYILIGRKKVMSEIDEQTLKDLISSAKWVRKDITNEI